MRTNGYLTSPSISGSHGNRELCEQQAESSFRFLRIGNTESKERCYDLCCQHKQCQVAIQSGTSCFGLHCARKEVCNLVSEQLAQFEGHRVDKRSIDDLDDDWAGKLHCQFIGYMLTSSIDWLIFTSLRFLFAHLELCQYYGFCKNFKS